MAVQKFYRRGITKFKLIPTIADYLGVGATTAEIAAGTDITPGIASVSGFANRNQKIDTPDGDTDFVGNIPGENRPEDSGITYYENQLTDTIRTTLANGTNAYIAVFPKGTAATKPVELWPVRLAEWNRLFDMTGNVAAQEMIDIAITGKPNKDAVVPT